MAKFKVEFEVQSLKLKIEGEREDAAMISRAIGDQMAGLMQPAGMLIDGEATSGNMAPAETLAAPSPIRKKTRRVRTVQPSSDTQAAAAIDFVHNPEKFGNPLQAWKTSEKALWLQYVLKETTANRDAPGRVLAETFNKHFKQSGMIQVGNLNRDLGKLKVGEKPVPLGEDTTKSPSTWFLTDEGGKRAQTLVAKALGEGK